MNLTKMRNFVNVFKQHELVLFSDAAALFSAAVWNPFLMFPKNPFILLSSFSCPLLTAFSSFPCKLCRVCDGVVDPFTGGVSDIEAFVCGFSSALAGDCFISFAADLPRSLLTYDYDEIRMNIFILCAPALLNLRT